MVELVSKATQKVLTELTGEPRVDVALRITLKDSIDHRLEIIEREISAFERKYKMFFKEFKHNWDEGKIPDKYSFEVERDYWEWEGLISRKGKIEGVKEWLI
ncbi:hypothetical protein KKH56_01860 [bacterium]|nr:hypothetical protein [bacterium]